MKVFRIAVASFAVTIVLCSAAYGKVLSDAEMEKMDIDDLLHHIVTGHDTYHNKYLHAKRAYIDYSKGIMHGSTSSAVLNMVMACVRDDAEACILAGDFHSAPGRYNDIDRACEMYKASARLGHDIGKKKFEDCTLRINSVANSAGSTNISTQDAPVDQARNDKVISQQDVIPRNNENENDKKVNRLLDQIPGTATHNWDKTITISNPSSVPFFTTTYGPPLGITWSKDEQYIRFGKREYTSNNWYSNRHTALKVSDASVVDRRDGWTEDSEHRVAHAHGDGFRLQANIDTMGSRNTRYVFVYCNSRYTSKPGLYITLGLDKDIVLNDSRLICGGSSFHIAPDGRHVLMNRPLNSKSDFATSGIYIYDIKNSTQRLVVKTSEEVLGVSISPSGKRIAYLSYYVPEKPTAFEKKHKRLMALRIIDRDNGEYVVPSSSTICANTRVASEKGFLAAEKEKQDKIAAEKRRNDAVLAAYASRKSVGDKVCMDGTKGIFKTPMTVIGFVEGVAGDKIQVRILEGSGVLNNVSFSRNTILWSSYSEWRKCN